MFPKAVTNNETLFSLFAISWLDPTLSNFSSNCYNIANTMPPFLGLTIACATYGIYHSSVDWDRIMRILLHTHIWACGYNECIWLDKSKSTPFHVLLTSWLAALHYINIPSRINIIHWPQDQWSRNWNGISSGVCVLWCSPITHLWLLWRCKYHTIEALLMQIFDYRNCRKNDSRPWYILKTYFPKIQNLHMLSRESLHHLSGCNDMRSVLFMTVHQHLTPRPRDRIATHRKLLQGRENGRGRRVSVLVRLPSRKFYGLKRFWAT